MSNAFEILQENASGFFQKQLINYDSNINCSLGCNDCCLYNLSIYTGEAILIINLFKNNIQLINTELLFSNIKNDKKCLFLINENGCNICSIYKVRPIICRTQGAAIMWREITNNTKKSSDDVTIYINSCLKNFDNCTNLPSMNDCLDIERLNVLSSIAQKSCQKNINLPAELKVYEQRIFLYELYFWLKQNLSSFLI